MPEAPVGSTRRCRVRLRRGSIPAAAGAALGAAATEEDEEEEEQVMEAPVLPVEQYQPPDLSEEEAL
jgi:hypothetical protein